MWRRVNEVKLDKIINTHTFQHQYNTIDVDSLDFGYGIILHFILEGP